MRKYVLLFFLITNIICFGQDRKVELEIIGGKKYNELYIRSRQLNNRVVSFAGEAVNDFLWIFTIPDSVVIISTDFIFRTKSQPGVGNNFIKFLGKIQGKTLIGQEINFENDEKRIRLKVEYRYTTHEINSQYIPQLKKTVNVEEWDADYFFIDPNQNRHLRETMIDPSFGFFYGVNGYDDALNEYALKIKENPNSQRYMARLAATPDFYKKKEDIAYLYYLFSDKMQRSYFGKIVYNHFSTFKIENVLLTNCETEMEERIVVDNDKYTLLIFSASWCAPCHKKIPMLKEIYKELNMNLDLVYITIDDEELLPQWRKLMLSENIPWRSLSLNNKKIKDNWSVRAIPDYILINSKLEARKINLNDDKDKNSLALFVQDK